MKTYALNKSLSRFVYERISEEIEPGACYYNISWAVKEFVDNFEDGEWRVAYGYWNTYLAPNAWTRHCFILNDEDEVIDPSALFSGVYQDYSVFAELDLDEYCEALEQNNNQPDLTRALLDKDNEHRLELKKNGYKIIEPKTKFM